MATATTAAIGIVNEVVAVRATAALAASATLSATFVRNLFSTATLSTGRPTVVASASLVATAVLSPSSSNIRVTQFGVEAVIYGGNANIRVTQFGLEIIIRPSGSRFVPFSVAFGHVRNVPLSGALSTKQRPVPIKGAFHAVYSRAVPMQGSIGYRRNVPFSGAFLGKPSRPVPVFAATRAVGHVPLYMSLWPATPSWKVVSNSASKALSLASHLVGGSVGHYLGFPTAINAGFPPGWDGPTYDDSFWPLALIGEDGVPFIVPFPTPDPAVQPCDFDWRWPNPTNDYASNGGFLGTQPTCDPWSDQVLLRTKFGLPNSQAVVNFTTGVLTFGAFSPYFMKGMAGNVNGIPLPFLGYQINNFGGVVMQYSVPSSALRPGTNVVSLTWSAQYTFSTSGKPGGFQLLLTYRPAGLGTPQVIG